jgi:tripartite-type tricarboxylate transporter receptor subunit TctC
MHDPHRRRLFLARASAASAALALGPRAHAQANWPQAPIKVIIPFAAGGSTDMLTRMIGKIVGDRLGHPIVVDNRGGAGGIIGTNAIAKAQPDGYTFGMTTVSSVVSAPIINTKVPFDVDREIAFVSQIVTVPMILGVHPSIPVNTAPELMQYLRRNKGKLSYGSVAVGHYGHVAAAHIDETQDAGMAHVPYKGEAPMLQDLIAGQLQMTFLTIATTKAHSESGKVKVLAITGTQRHEAMPNIPTFAEQGLGDEVFKLNPGWIGMIAPAKTPPAIVQRMSAEVQAAVRQPELHERITALGMNLVGGTPEAFLAAYKAEIPRWKDLLTRAGVKPE